MKIILANNEEIEVADATFGGHYVINCANSAAYQNIWNKFTSNNLSTFKLIDNNDKILVNKIQVRLLSTQAIINQDNTVVGHFYFSKGLDVPNEYEAAGKILLGEDEV